MIEPILFRDNIVTPALVAICSYTDDSARDIVLETAIIESGLRAVKQVGGPALGFFQMEPATHDDIFSNYLGASSRQYLLDGLATLTNQVGSHKELEINPFYAAAMCRIHYLRCKGQIPKYRTGRAEYWKKNYNTHLGKGKVEEYLERNVL